MKKAVFVPGFMGNKKNINLLKKISKILNGFFLIIF